MSIATAIQNAQTKVANAYTAVSTKGGTLPATQDLANLPTAINSIPSGGSSTKYGISIDDLLGEVDGNGDLQALSGGDVDLVISGFTGVSPNVFNYKFMRCYNLKSVSFPDLERVDVTSGFDRAFNNCTNLESVSFPSLVTANGNTAFSYCFQSCTSLKSASFPMLEETIGTSSFQYIFNGCTELTNVYFPSLRIIGNKNAGANSNYRHFHNAFTNCRNITELSFPALEEIWCNGNAANTGTFSINAYVQKFYFPKLGTITKTDNYNSTLGANNIFNGCTALTELHFGATNQSAIQATTGYSTKWGAPSTCTIYFDL